MSKILLGISNGLIKGTTYYPSGFMEQIAGALRTNGNDVLVYVPNRFQKQMFGGDNALLDGIDATKLDEDIKNFAPDLVITFNNTIYNKTVELTDCPVVVWGADTEPLWNAKDLIKKNLDRYYFFCFSKQEMKPRQERFHVADDRIFLMKPATAIKNTNMAKDKNISFIGTFFSTSWSWLNFVEKYRGTHDLMRLINNFKTYFTDGGDVTKDISDGAFIADLKKIASDDYIAFFSGEKRTQTLMSVADLGLHLWGNKNWKKAKEILPSLYACLHKESVASVSENEYVYNTSKICLNVNHDQSVNGINFRICDVLASGGCLVSSYSPFVKQEFKEIGIPMFSDGFEARALCQKLLKSDRLRKKIVKKSNAIIDKKWRWQHRFLEMERILGISLLNGQNGSLTYLEPAFAQK